MPTKAMIICIPHFFFFFLLCYVKYHIILFDEFLHIINETSYLVNLSFLKILIDFQLFGLNIIKYNTIQRILFSVTFSFFLFFFSHIFPQISKKTNIAYESKIIENVQDLHFVAFNNTYMFQNEYINHIINFKVKIDLKNTLYLKIFNLR